MKILILQYKIKLRYNEKLHQEKVIAFTKWCSDKNIGIQAKKHFEEEKHSMTFYAQIRRQKEESLYKWQSEIEKKIKQIFNRIPEKQIELVENQGFEKLEDIVREFEGAKS